MEKEGRLATECHLIGPLYEQVLGRLLQRIQDGEWKVGVPLPSEVHLSHEFGVSVGTMRKALDMLVKQRVVSRKRGRGTFVKDRQAGESSHSLIFRDLDGESVDVQIEVTDHETGNATACEVDALQLSGASVARVLRINRKWEVQSKLVCLESIVIPVDRLPDTSIVLNSVRPTLHDIYAMSCHLSVDRTIWTFEPIGSAELAANYPGVDLQSPWIRFNRVVLSENDIPIELARQSVRFDGLRPELRA